MTTSSDSTYGKSLETHRKSIPSELQEKPERSRHKGALGSLFRIQVTGFQEKKVLVPLHRAFPVLSEANFRLQSKFWMLTTIHYPNKFTHFRVTGKHFLHIPSLFTAKLEARL